MSPLCPPAGNMVLQFAEVNSNRASESHANQPLSQSKAEWQPTPASRREHCVPTWPFLHGPKCLPWCAFPLLQEGHLKGQLGWAILLQVKMTLLSLLGLGIKGPSLRLRELVSFPPTSLCNQSWQVPERLCSAGDRPSKSCPREGARQHSDCWNSHE